MLHAGILPHHPRWAKLFENLRFIIIDELHAYRGVFGSHLAQRAAPAAAHVPPLRIGSAVHLLVGDHRQPGGAGRAAGRAAVHADREERRAARREVLRVRQPADREPRAGHPPLVPGRNAPRRGRVPAPQPAGDRVRAEPPGDRDSHDLSQGRLRGRAGHARADPRLPRRLPAAAPARDREGTARRPGARRGLDQRARAGHRHRRARRVDHGRLSGHDCRHVAARGPRRPPRRAIRGGDGGVERAGRSVRGPAPVLLLRRLARARADQSGQPAHPGRITSSAPRSSCRSPPASSTAGWTCRRCSACCRKPVSCIARAATRTTTHGAVELDQRIVSGRRGEPALGVVRQLRRRRSDRRAEGDRRNRFHQRAVDAAPEGHLHRRRPPVPGGEARLRRPQGATCARWTATTTPTPSTTRR